jgi:PleD family two-component response regulator
VGAEKGLEWLRNFKKRSTIPAHYSIRHMPQMDGFELENKKLDKELTSQIIIFMLSSTLDSLDKRAKQHQMSKQNTSV